VEQGVPALTNTEAAIESLPPMALYPDSKKNQNA